MPVSPSLEPVQKCAERQQRETELRNWVVAQLGVDAEQVVAEWQSVVGDASCRRYFRFTPPRSRAALLAMDAPPDSEDLSSFIAIGKRLNAAGLRAPAILASDADHGFALLEDFGDGLLKHQLQAENGECLYQRLLPVLSGLAVDVDCGGLPDYSQHKLLDELALFPDWYLAHHTGCVFDAGEQQLWQSFCELLLASALEQPQVFVHRDFHSCNLLALGVGTDDDSFCAGDTGIIDFQDAVRGPLSYDLVSWLWDRYIAWPRAQQVEWIERFRLHLCANDSAVSQWLAAVDPMQWRRYCDWMGLQRNLKVVGIFARLHQRDGRDGYVEMIPTFARYVRDVLACYPELESYRQLLVPRL